MTDTPTTPLRQRAAGLAASALVLASLLLTPASALAAGGGPGTPPTLVDDVIATSEETPVTGNVLDNDVNSSGVVPFTVTTYTQPAASVGTLVIDSDGSYTFTPAPNFFGSGSATYMASNTKHEVGPAQITINVTNTQDPPVANDDTATVTEDTATDVTSAILANDSDPDGDTLSVTGVSGATGGAVDLTAGVVTFTPAADLCGPDAGSFDYSLSATGGTDTAHVAVDITCVNDAPVAVDDAAAGTEDTDVLIAESDLVSNDTDVEGDSLSVIGVSNASGGSVSRSDGTVTFTPAANLCGDNAASFDYTLGDGNSGNDTGTVTIDLACEPEAPVANDDTASGTEDMDVVIPAGDLTANDTDADGDPLTVTAVTNAQGGTVVLDSGTVTFTPDANACGTGEGSFDYTVDDGGNGGSDTGSVTIDITCVNDAPVATDDTASATEDTATDVTSAILANDTDADGDTLSVSGVSNPTGGTVELVGGVVTFTPDAGACGTGEGGFDYDVTDGTDTDSGHVTVDVTCVNDAPVAVDDSASGTEDTDLVIDGADLVANDTDADSGDTLSVSGVSNASGGTVSLDGGSVTFTPDANDCGLGEGSFDYTVDDGNGGTDTGSVTVDITCVNDAPVAVDDSASGTEDSDVVIDAADLVTNDTDAEGDSLWVSGVSNATGGSVSLDSGSITFTPDANACDPTPAGFDYTVTDGTDSDTGHVSVSLDCVNDAPVANDDSASGTEDTALVVSDLTDLTGNDTDVDSGDTLSVTGVSNATGGTATFDSEAGTITFTPTADACDPTPAGFDYDLSDGNGGSDTAHVTVDLTCVNDSPVAGDDTASGTEDTALVISDLTDLTGNDTDVDAGTTLTIAGISNPVGGTISYDFLVDSITFTPTANLCGPGAGSFDYTVTDGTAFDTGHVTIDITCVNDNPVAGDDVATVQQDSGAADHDVLGNDSDVDGDTPSLTGATIDVPAHGTASVNGTKVSYTPAAGFAGTAVITYTIGDGQGGTDTGTLTVTVNPAGVDTTPPAPTVPALAIGAVGRVDTTAPVVISWSATDAGSGVASYLVQVSVGGHPYKTIYSGTGHSIRQVYAFNKSIVVRVRATDHEGNTSGWVLTPRHRLVAIQNIATGVKYTSPWTWVTSMPSSGDGYSFTTQLGSAGTLRFYGQQIAYVAPKLSTGGFVKVFLDGHLLGRYSVKKATLALGQIIARTNVTGGFHTIRVVNDQAGKRTTLDAFVILR